MHICLKLCTFAHLRVGHICLISKTFLSSAHIWLSSSYRSYCIYTTSSLTSEYILKYAYLSQMCTSVHLRVGQICLMSKTFAQMCTFDSANHIIRANHIIQSAFTWYFREQVCTLSNVHSLKCATHLSCLAHLTGHMTSHAFNLFAQSQMWFTFIWMWSTSFHSYESQHICDCCAITYDSYEWNMWFKCDSHSYDSYEWNMWF